MKNRPIILLSVLGNLLTISVATGVLIAFSDARDNYGEWVWWLTAVPLGLHVAASVFTQKRFERKHGLSAGKFLLYGALPAAVIGAVGFLAFLICIENRLWGYGSDFKGFVEIMITLAISVYSAGYMAALAAVLGISCAVRKKKEHL